MSGGHWNYAGVRIENELATIGEDETVVLRFPRLATALRDLGMMLYRIEQELDWDISADVAISNDADFQERALALLSTAVAK